MKPVRAIMIGDVVGEPGLLALEHWLPELVGEDPEAFVVVNGENAADGFGITQAELQRILGTGADVVTSGNHVWEKREFWPVLETESRVLRPANYPEMCSGKGWLRVEKAGLSWLVINLQGRELMQSIDCPFKTFDNIVHAQISRTEETELPDSAAVIPFILVDFHAESTREKEALGYYLDGRASLVAGTHTHILTADEKILPKGTGYITDLGMTGVLESIIGMNTKICLDRVRTQILYRMERAEGLGSIQGIIAEIDRETGKTISIQRITKK